MAIYPILVYSIQGPRDFVKGISARRSKSHQAVFGELAPVDAGVFFSVDNLFLALGAAPLGLIREKLDLCAALRAFDVADL